MTSSLFLRVPFQHVVEFFQDPSVSASRAWWPGRSYPMMHPSAPIAILASIGSLRPARGLCTGSLHIWAQIKTHLPELLLIRQTHLYIILLHYLANLTHIRRRDPAQTQEHDILLLDCFCLKKLRSLNNTTCLSPKVCWNLDAWVPSVLISATYSLEASTSFDFPC